MHKLPTEAVPEVKVRGGSSLLHKSKTEEKREIFDT